ncbi:MAG TPA: DNA repair protein RecO [Candidatus Paceibacterota bacterium]|nr:DNA repair protein RecO [Candidatus Paceibacterota bacterium]HPT18073.1 DNA repair protein RecO [Candidatus Paceibacterota bacterium]
MHHIYHTEGIILSSRNTKEADRSYAIFTRDLGMIYASAQGIRKISSKLRFVLQDFSHVKIDFVRGKDYWRITNALKTPELEEIKKEKQKLMIFANISNLLKRLLAGEEPNSSLFDDLLNGLSFLEKSKSKNELQNIEAIIVLRILSNLGYIGASNSLNTIIKTPFDEKLVLEADKKRTKILSEINKAISESHL